MAKNDGEASSVPVVVMFEELLKHILSFVPVESLLRFKLVSKSFYSTISNDPKFVRLHLNHAQNNPKNHASFVTQFNKTDKLTHLHLNNNNDDDDNDDDGNCNCDCANDLDLPFRRRDFPLLLQNPMMALHGSCEGLLCGQVKNDFLSEKIFLWNPATKHSLLLPGNGISLYEINEDWEYIGSSLGFGFEPVEGDYKVVRVLDFKDDGSYGMVYSTKECVWREVKFVEAFLMYDSSAACVKGVLYWVLFPKVGLLTFDLRSEVFGVHRFPEDVIKAFGDGYNLTVKEYDDSVVLFSWSEGEEDRSSYVISMWTFCDACVDGNGSIVRGSWSRKYTFKVDRTVNFVYGYLRTGYFLIQDASSVLFLYNPDKEETRDVSHLGCTREIFRYTASLVSIPGSEKAKWKPTYSKEEERRSDYRGCVW